MKRRREAGKEVTKGKITKNIALLRTPMEYLKKCIIMYSQPANPSKLIG